MEQRLYMFILFVRLFPALSEAEVSVEPESWLSVNNASTDAHLYCDSPCPS